MERIGNLAARAAIVVLACAPLAACDVQRTHPMEVGVSTETDVRAQFGEPAAVYEEEDGGRTFEYPRQPEGQVNYLITIGAQGRLVAIRQVLNPDRFASITPGLDKAQVRRLIGRPARAEISELENEEVWDWRWLDGTQSKVFSVTFDSDGKVQSTAVSDETAAR
jgi:hypothetical protein